MQPVRLASLSHPCTATCNQLDLRIVAVQSPAANAAVENELVQLLDFDKFQLIKALMQNRLKIVWCMRLHRAQTDEEQARIQVRIWYDEAACLTYFAVRSRPAGAAVLQTLLPGQSASSAGHLLMLTSGYLRQSDEAQRVLPVCPGLHAPLRPFRARCVSQNLAHAQMPAVSWVF